jgi:hypothetical protein
MDTMKIKINGNLENLMNVMGEISKNFGFRYEGHITILSSGNDFILYSISRKFGIYFFNTADKIATKHNCSVQGVL